MGAYLRPHIGDGEGTTLASRMFAARPLTALMRRTLGLLCAAYFDDNATIEFEHEAPQAKALRQSVFAAAGTPPKASKSFPMQWHRAFLGAVVDVQDVSPDGDGFVYIMPKDSSRRQVALDIEAALCDGRMSTAQAAKTSGRSSWVATNAFGRIGRLGMAVLKFLQYHRTHHLTHAHRRALAFHAHIVTSVPPKQVSATRSPARPILLYSDAEYEPDSGRRPQLGWVPFPPHGGTPIGHAMLLPQAV